MHVIACFTFLQRRKKKKRKKESAKRKMEKQQLRRTEGHKKIKEMFQKMRARKGIIGGGGGSGH